MLYELIGPACAKLALFKSKSYAAKLEDLVPDPPTTSDNEVEQLIARIQAIQNDLPRHDNPYYEDEQAFSEAAEEHYQQIGRTLPQRRHSK